MTVYGLYWAGPGYRQVVDACECGNEPCPMPRTRKIINNGHVLLRRTCCDTSEPLNAPRQG